MVEGQISLSIVCLSFVSEAVYARVVSIAVLHLMLTTPAHLVTQFFARAHAGVCSFLAGFGLPPPDPERIKREIKYSVRRLAGYVSRMHKDERVT